MADYQELQREKQELLSRIEQLEKELQGVRRAALNLADANTRASSAMYAAAKKIQAESDPAHVESQRQANAILTDENQRLSAENAGLREAKEYFKCGVEKGIELIVTLEGIIDRAAGDREYRGELIDDLRSAIEAARGVK